MEELSNCSLCTKKCTPSMHTCHRCLQNHDKQSSDELSRSLCRTDAVVSGDGPAETTTGESVDEKPTDGYGRQFVRAANAAVTPCDACSEEAEHAQNASMYCIECQQNYCQRCSQTHRKMKFASEHTQVEIHMHRDGENQAKLPADTCVKHPSQEQKWFCRDCKVLICTKCIASSHDTHSYSDFETTSEELCEQLRGDTDKVAKCLDKFEAILLAFEKQKSEFDDHITGVVNEVNKAVDKLIAAIERDRGKLLSELKSIREKRVKQVETVKQEVEQHKTALESCKRYCEAVMSTGTACDVAKATNSLHGRAEQLLASPMSSRLNSLAPVVSFVSSTFSESENNLVGTITCEDGVRSRSKPTVTQVVGGEKKREIRALASLDNSVFVARRNSSQIEVYDADSLSVTRRLSVPGHDPVPYGLAACGMNTVLYVSDYWDSLVHQFELTGNSWAGKWTVSQWPVGISVTRTGNLLVICQGEGKLQEYASTGTLLRDVQLPSDVENPWQAVQFASGEFVVSHTGSSHRVCLIGVNGQVLRSYHGQSGSDHGLNEPIGLALDKDDRILVADSGNDRLLVLDRSLSCAREVKIAAENGWNEPCCLWFDEQRSRLYVGEETGCRLVVVDNVSDFDAL